MTLILIYLLPILFMLHEFEEMVMLPAWIEKNEKNYPEGFPHYDQNCLFYKVLHSALPYVRSLLL